MATFPTFPAIDLSKFDLSNLGNLNMPTIDIPGVDGEKLAAALRDAAYITIGFGVLTFQQAQVRRRELVASLSTRFGASKTQIDELLTKVESRMGSLDERFDAFEAKLDGAVDKLEQRLPDQAAALLGQAHDVAKAARKQVRGLVRSAA